MNINYRNENIIEAEIVDGYENVKVACPKCGDVWLLEEEDILQPWPGVKCPHCGEWIPLS